MLRLCVGSAARLARCVPRGPLGVRCVSAAPPRAPLLTDALASASSVLRATPWQVRLDDAQRSLGETRRRIGLVGTTASRVPELARALLYEPLDRAAAAALDDHGAALGAFAGNVVRFRSGAPARDEAAGIFTLPSAWLAHADAELTVILDPHADAAHTDLLYTCDVLCFVTDMEALARAGAARAGAGARGTCDATLELLADVATKPHTMLAVNIRDGEQASYAAVAEHAERALGASMLTRLGGAREAVGGPLAGVMVVSSTLAGAAKAQLAAALASPQSAATDAQWASFARLYNGSYVPVLEHALTRAAGDSPPGARALAVLRAALDDAESGARTDAELVRMAEAHADVLESRAEAALARTAADVLPDAAPAAPGAAQIRRGDAPASVRAALADARHLVEHTFSALPWWSLPWRIDTVRTALQHAVARSFAAGLEVQLAYAAGLLRGVAARQAAEADAALSEIAAHERARGTHAFDTATLRNSLARFSDAQLRDVLTPTSLLGPIAERRAQLLSPCGPIDQLTAGAQSAVLRAQLVAGTSYVVAAAALLRGDVLSMSPANAAALALLGTAFSAWSVQGAWAQLKRRFWTEWERVAEATERAERTHVDAVLRDKVFGAPLYTAAALRDAARVQASVHAAHAERLGALARQVESAAAADP